PLAPRSGSSACRGETSAPGGGRSAPSCGVSASRGGASAPGWETSASWCRPSASTSEPFAPEGGRPASWCGGSAPRSAPPLPSSFLHPPPERRSHGFEPFVQMSFELARHQNVLEEDEDSVQVMRKLPHQANLVPALAAGADGRIADERFEFLRPFAPIFQVRQPVLEAADPHVRQDHWHEMP